jgi:hypothetical protein
MLWRERYDTRVLNNVFAPIISGVSLAGDHLNLQPGEIAVCGFSPEAYMGMGVWLRLIQDEYGLESLRLIFFSGEWSAEQEEDLSYVIPKSLHNQTLLAREHTAFWHGLIEPDHPGRAFAALISSEGVRCLMIGPPTEERWDEFQLAVSSLGA